MHHRFNLTYFFFFFFPVSYSFVEELQNCTNILKIYINSGNTALTPVFLTIFKHLEILFSQINMDMERKQGKNNNHSNSNCSHDVYVLPKGINIKRVGGFQPNLKNHAKSSLVFKKSLFAECRCPTHQSPLATLSYNHQ